MTLENHMKLKSHCLKQMYRGTAMFIYLCIVQGYFHVILQSRQVIDDKPKLFTLWTFMESWMTTLLGDPHCSIKLTLTLSTTEGPFIDITESKMQLWYQSGSLLPACTVPRSIHTWSQHVIFSRRKTSSSLIDKVDARYCVKVLSQNLNMDLLGFTHWTSGRTEEVSMRFRLSQWIYYYAKCARQSYQNADFFVCLTFKYYQFNT